MPFRLLLPPLLPLLRPRLDILPHRLRPVIPPPLPLPRLLRRLPIRTAGDMMTVLIDTREQRPWSFPPDIATEIATIQTGDYALKGDEKNFAIERKSADDFIGTISVGWHRFCREINRMDAAGFAAKVIIVETDFYTFCYANGVNGEIIPPDHEHTRCCPGFIMRRIAELTMRGVSVLFAGNANFASALALKILSEREKEICR